MRNLKHIGVAASGVLLFAGCAPREEQQVVVQQPPTTVIEKTKIKPVPVPPNKTVVVKPAPQPAPKTTTKTQVTVAVPPPTAPSTLPAPAARPTPKISVRPTPQSSPRIAAVPTSTPRPTPSPKPTPKPTPRPMPTMKPMPRPAKAPVSKSGPLTVRAEIVAVSKVPDPKTVAYKESIVFYKYKVLSVENGKYDEQEILAAQWGMKNKKLLPASRYRIGQVQTLQVEPLEKHPELESVMRNDDTGEFDLEPYWVKSVG